jgi:hypothetical protein
MKIRNIARTATVSLGLALAMWVAPKAMAQQQWDLVYVNLPYTITVGQKILPPGQYTIEQADNPDSTTLLFRSANGMKFETSAMTLRVLYSGVYGETPQTSVILQHIGDEYYFNKLWVAGRDYG